ncbi:MAG: hypothetical protein RR336_10205, partial [Oscillospiraceae bacterium]
MWFGGDGAGLERPDLQLTPQEPEPKAKGDWRAEGVPVVQLNTEEPPKAGSDEQSLPAFLDAQLMKAIVLDEGGRRVKRQEIFAYFQSHKNYEERCAFLQNAYTDTFVELSRDSRRFGYKKQTNGLLMWEGNYLSRTAESGF